MALTQTAVFLDKDGTLVEDVPYNIDPEEIVFVKNAAEGLRRLHRAGFRLIVVSNQSGVAHGFFAEKALQAVHERIAVFFRTIEIPLHGFYYCPHLPDGRVKAYAMECDCRKPAPGLLLRAAADMNLDLTRSWMVGDILNDVEAGRRAGCRTVLINNGNETEWLLSLQRRPDLIASDLKEAADLILSCQKEVLPIPNERGSSPYRTYSKPALNSKAAGAGDTFVSALTLALGAGADAPAAGELAAAAAEIVVLKDDTASCSGQELFERLPGDEKLITDFSRLASKLETYRQRGLRIVFTNGCFDILHRGHITYLSRAKALGNVLIVGVNSDASINRLKGPSRPITKLEDRLQVLAALSCIDHLVPFEEDSPVRLIEAVKPEIFVKGGDYTKDTLPEAALVERLGGRIEILPYVEDQSTSGIIDRIRVVYSGEEKEKESTLLQFPHLNKEPVYKSVYEEQWCSAENILCIRLDTIGDVLMSSPAMRAIKESRPGRRITLLTGLAGASAAKLIPEIADVIVYNAPWMKATTNSYAENDFAMIRELKSREFDSAVIFTVYSQNPLPAAFLCHMAEIPLRLAHCRENPYSLLTDWIRDPEPDSGIRHEVQRQLDLVGAVGYHTNNERLSVSFSDQNAEIVRKRLRCAFESTEHAPLIGIHPGASAASRRYPIEAFAETARQLITDFGCRIVLTGTVKEKDLVETIQSATSIRIPAFLDLKIEEFAALISQYDALISNNTSAVHIAAGTGTPVVDLYALTNPQHTPWQVSSRVLSHDVPCKYCYSSVCPQEHHHCLRLISPTVVVRAVLELLQQTQAERDSNVVGVSV